MLRAHFMLPSWFRVLGWRDRWRPLPAAICYIPGRRHSGMGEGPTDVIIRLVCLLSAVLLGSVGLMEQSVVMMTVAAGSTALALSGLGGRACRTGVAPWSSLLVWVRLTPKAWSLVGFAAGFSVLALAFPSINLLTALFWGLAMASLVAIGFELDGLPYGVIRDGIRTALAPEHRAEVASVAAIMVVAFVMRAYRVDTIPPMFHGDEGEVGLTAVSVLEGRSYPILTTSPEWALPYIFTYMQAASLSIFGVNATGIRMLSVVFGTLCIPFVYAIGRVGWGPAAGATAAWLLAVNHLHVHYSRIGLVVIQSALLMCVLMLLLALVYRRSRPDAPDALLAARGRGVWTLLLVAGLVGGLAQYFYYSSRLIPIIVAPILLILWRARRIHPWQVLAFVFAFAVVYAPLVADYVEHPARFFGRLRDLTIFNEGYVREIVGPTGALPGSLPALFAEHIRRSLNLFVRGGDLGGFYSGNTPQFDVVTALLIWLGLGATLAHWRRYHEAALLLWFGLGLWFGSVMTRGAFSGQRILVMVAAGQLMAGVLVVRLYALLQRLPSHRLEWLAVPLGTTAALWLLSVNVTIYFYEYAGRGESAEQAEVAREIVKDSESYHIYFLTSPAFDPNHGAIRFLARGVPATNLQRASDFKRPPPDGRGIKLIVLENHRDDLRAIQPMLPPGEERRVNAGNGRLMFTVYTVPPGR